MKPNKPCIWPVVLFLGGVCAVGMPAQASSASWTTATSGSWSTGPWSAAYPNAAGETATFNQDWTGQTVTVDGTYTVGSILGTDTTAGGNPVLLISGGVLILNNSASKPVIQATTFGEFTRFKITTELQGANGFEKTGSGYLDLAGSSNTFTGNVKLNGGGGFVVLNNDANLGNSANDIDVATTTSATGFYVDNGVTVTLNSGRNIALTGGGNFWGKTKGAGNLIIEGQITGTGGFLKNDSGTVTLRGANSYSGATTLQLGTLKLENGNNRLPTGTTLAYIDNTTLDIGGFSQQVAALTVTAGKQVAATNGSLSVIGNNDLNLSSNVSGVTHNFSGLTNFSYDGSGASNKTFTLRNTASTAFDVTTRLAAGINVITVKTVDIGSAGPISDLALTKAILRLGATNTINADSMAIGGYRSDGLVNFDTGVSGGSLKIRGLDTTSAMSTLTLGQVNSGNSNRVATLDLTGGTLDAKVGTLLVGQHYAGANNSVTASLTMPGGTVEATSLILGDKSGSTGSPTLQSTYTQAGGTVKAATVAFGQQTGAGGATPVLKPTYNLNGGSLYAATIDGGVGGFNTTSSDRNLNLGGGTLRNYDATTNLTVDGVDSSAGGRLNVNVTALSTIHADAGRTVSFTSNTALTGSGNLSKAGSGTLVIGGASSSYTGTLTVSAGSLLVTGQLGAAGSSVSVSNDATLGGSGTIGGSLSFAADGKLDFASALVVNGATVTFGSGFDMANILGLNSTVANGTYTLISGLADVDLTGVLNVGAGNAYNLGAGKSAYFQEGSLQVVVIPEPAAALLGGLGFLALLRRRR